MHNKVQQLQSDMHRPHSGSEAGKDTVDFPVAVLHSPTVLSALAVSIRVPYVAQNIRDITHTHTQHTDQSHLTHTYTYARTRREGSAKAADLVIESNTRYFAFMVCEDQLALPAHR